MSDNQTHNRMAAFGWSLHAAGLGVTVALVGASVGLLYLPIGMESRRLDAAAQSASQYLRQYSAVESERDVLKDVLAEREQSHVELASRVPNTMDESEFLAQLAQLARATGVEINQYNPGQPVEEASHGSLEIVLKARAPYANACHFLAGLEELPRLCRAKSMRLLAPQSGSSDCQLEMTLQIFYLNNNLRNEHEVGHG